MLSKLIFLFIALPVAIILILLSVANRHSVQLNLDPFNSVDPAVAFSLPFFVFLFAALMIGMVLGSMATWFRQGRYRKAARREHTDAVKWQSEAENQKKRAEELAVELNPELKAISLSDRAA